MSELLTIGGINLVCQDLWIRFNDQGRMTKATLHIAAMMLPELECQQMHTQGHRELSTYTK